jgi:hypothetical protein
MITNIITHYNEIIKKYLVVIENKLTAFVTEKNQPTLRNQKYHDGIHIIYPYICTTPEIQLLMREDFLKLALQHKIFNKIPLINSLEEVFDKNIIQHTSWMLYGSKKNSISSVYRATHIYAVNDNKLVDKLIMEDINQRSYIRFFIRNLSCRKFNNVNELTPYNNTTMNIINTNKPLPVKKQISCKPNYTNLSKLVSDNVRIEAKNLVKLLSINRAKDYHSWIQVGRCLHDIDEKLLNVWIEFSKKCPEKYHPTECESLWKKMHKGSYTMATLHFYANTDNPDKYLEMKAMMHDKVNKYWSDITFDMSSRKRIKCDSLMIEI